jgi:hypothetical protein
VKAKEMDKFLPAMLGFMPFQPEQLLFNQVTSQPEFLPGSEAAQIQSWIDARGWDWRFVCRVPTTGLMVLKRPFTEDELTLCLVPNPRELTA